MLSTPLNLPFPEVLKRPFWDNNAATICAIVICTVSLLWIGFTLRTFGKSFRVGIDVNIKDKLITTGTFSVSRNPIYLAFIVFFLGFFTVHPSISSALFVCLLSAAVHRQIIREEKFLHSHYAEEYEEYCKKVRRYL